MASTVNGENLKIDQVDKLDEVFDAIILGEEHGIDLEGLETIEQIKRRMHCHINMQLKQKDKVSFHNSVFY